MGGNVEICFRFTIIDDDCVEDKEYFEVELVSSDSYVDIHISSATVTIWDNDCKWLSLVVIGEFYAFFVFSDALFGFQEEVYYVGENAGFVRVCIELFDGCLERDVYVECKKFGATADSTCYPYLPFLQLYSL